MLIFLDKVTQLVDEGKDIDIIYWDFAFDKVPHQRLLIKLREVEVLSGSPHGWATGNSE